MSRNLWSKDAAKSGDERKRYAAQWSWPSQVWHGTLRSTHDDPWHQVKSSCHHLPTLCYYDIEIE